MLVVNLVFDLPFEHSYSYLSDSLVTRGTRVRAKLRGKEQIGFVSSWQDASTFTAYPLAKLHNLISIYPLNQAIPEDVWLLCEFAASYYHHPFGATLFCAIPSLLRHNQMLNIDPEETNAYYQLIKQQVKIRGARCQAIWQKLHHQSLSYSQIKALLGHNPTLLIKQWLTRGIIAPSPPPAPTANMANFIPNLEQQQIINQVALKFGHFHCGLLYGITGSGKTEVFLQLIAKILNNGQQALVIVPEINLTPQLAQRFAARFPAANIGILSSSISDKQRLNTWQQAKTSSKHIILGTRLSVFTPFSNLGIIIVDEEHDSSFKQNDSLRYHARDLAVYRAKQLNIPIVLASATPSLESLYNYKLGKFSLYKLTQRAVINASLPQIKIIDLKHYPVNSAGLSQPALTALRQCLKRQELAMVFINRRGYAPILACYTCNWVSSCRNCSSKLVYHKSQQILKCHYCAYQIATPHSCPLCNNQYLQTIGHGTQHLEQFLAEHFKGTRILRIDRDTTTSANDWHHIYQQIQQQQVDILVGTQMLAKGHDFPSLSLVIGLNLDNALFSYDFRASEEMFATITQVAGRAGRATKAGHVLLQTTYAEHPIYHFIKHHNFAAFTNYTLQERKLNQLPPFSYQALIKLSSPSEVALSKALAHLNQFIAQHKQHGVSLFPALPATLYKLHQRYRGQMLITSEDRTKLHTYLEFLQPHLMPFNYVTIAIDVDPLEV